MRFKDSNEKIKLFKSAERKSSGEFLINRIYGEYETALSYKGEAKYYALEKLNAKRRNILKNIENKLEKEGYKSSVVVYFSSILELPGNEISSVEDTTYLKEVLSSVSSKSKKVSLIISELGGDMEAVIKFVRMIKKESQDGYFAIIPNIAKSGATVLALGADEILMGMHSELGPVDPQVSYNNIYMPANTYLNVYDDVAHNAKFTQKEHVIIPKQDEDRLYKKKLTDVDLILLKICADSIEYERKNLSSILENGSMKGKEKEEISSAVEKLIGGKLYTSHSSLIMYEDASSLGLNVKLFANDNPLWKLVEEYYVRAEAEMRINKLSKLFESRKDSLRVASAQSHEDGSVHDSTTQKAKAAPQKLQVKL